MPPVPPPVLPFTSMSDLPPAGPPAPRSPVPVSTVPVSTVLAVVAAVLARPGLWRVAFRQALRLARPQWWARPPFLPVPPRAYLRFRLVTAYGGDGGGVAASQVAGDVVAYLEWCRQWPGVVNAPR